MTEGPRINFVMREGLSYLHEKQTSRIQSLYLYFIKIVPFWLCNIRFFNTQRGGIQNSHRNSRLIRHENGFMEEWMSKFFLIL